MKQFMKTKSILFGALLFSLGLLSFVSAPSGGEGFEIYIGDKLVVQKYNKNLGEVQVIKLDRSYASQQMTVKYHHCGKVGKNRIITIKDDQNKVLKEWRYTDRDQMSAMSCQVKDILNFEKIESDEIHLFYASSELPKGRQLATIRFTQSGKATP